MAVIKTYYDYLAGLGAFEKKYAPKQLFSEGNFDLLTSGTRVSVVGSRKASPSGIQRASDLVKTLVSKEITIVSGLAEGIDTIAHSTAIASGGKTIAVLGTSLDQCFPKKNTALLEEIKHEHLAISQFPSGYPALPKNFPVRNKTMALISDATIIVEASEKSGTRHQGWEALRLGRLVLIMQNVADNPDVTWTDKMMEYGAQVLTRENLDSMINLIFDHSYSNFEFA